MTDTLAELERLLEGMSEDDKKELDSLLAPELGATWLPNPGPQTMAYESEADLLLYGGAAGGGKSDLLLGLGLTRHSASVIFRPQYVDLRGLERRLLEITGTRAGWNGADMILRRDGRVIEMGALAKPGAEFGWQGNPHDFIGFDEGAQLSAMKVMFVLGWLRSTKEGQRCRAVIASNPPIGGEGEWLIDWFAPWLDPLFVNPAAPGEIRWAVAIGREDRVEIVWVDGPEPVEIGGQTYTPLSRTFIPAFLDDNPYLKDTGYKARVENMPEPLRSKLLKGDFIAGREDHPWQVIPTEWIELAQKRWKNGKRGARMRTLGVDVAQGGADRTVLSPLYGVWFDEAEIHKGVDTKDGPTVAALVIKKLRDKALPIVDLTGGWGISTRDHLVGQDLECAGVVFSSGSGNRTRDGSLAFYNMRSELWWRFREALDPAANAEDEMPALPPGRGLLAELTAPRWELRGDKILIESKDDIRERLNASTDDADSKIMAWHGRAQAAMKTVSRQWKPQPGQTNWEASDPLADF